MNTRKLGQEKENELISPLLQSGHELLNQNYHTQFGEIDIITKKESRIHFIEVKYTRSLTIHPLHKLNAKKKKAFLHSALLYLEQEQFSDIDYQFDLIVLHKNQMMYYDNIIQEECEVC